MIALLSKSETKQDKAISTRKTTYVNSGAMAHMVMDNSVLSMNRKPSSGSIESATGEVEKVKSEGISKL